MNFVFTAEKKPAAGGYLLGLLFDLEEGGDTFLLNTPGCLRTMRNYNPEYRTLHSHRCENLRFKVYL
jgi:hypothetical protein